MTASRKRTLIPPTVQRADWRDARNYPPDKSTSPQRWAWEFLRRNLAYCADFERLQRAEANGTADALVCDPPAHPGETYSHYHQRMRKANKRESVQRLRSMLAAEWMVTDMADPNDPDAVGKDTGWGRFRILAPTLRYLLPPERVAELQRNALPDVLLSRISRVRKTVVWTPRHKSEVAVILDLRAPILDQLRLQGDLLSDLLRRWAKTDEKPKRARLGYVKALRLLDALAEGSPRGEVLGALGYRTAVGETRSLKRDSESAYRYCEMYAWVATRNARESYAR